MKTKIIPYKCILTIVYSSLCDKAEYIQLQIDMKIPMFFAKLKSLGTVPFVFVLDCASQVTYRT